MHNATILSLPRLEGERLCQWCNSPLHRTTFSDAQEDDGCWLDVVPAQIRLLVSSQLACEHIMHLHASSFLSLTGQDSPL